MSVPVGSAQTAVTVEHSCESDLVIGDVSLATHHALYAQYIYELEVMSAKAQGLFNANVDACFSACRGEYREGIRLCTVTTIESDDATAEDATPYAICIQYQHDRYRTCLDPLEECGARWG